MGSSRGLFGIEAQPGTTGKCPPRKTGKGPRTGLFPMGYLRDATGNFTAGLLVLGGCALVGGLVALTLKVNRNLELATAASLAR